MTNELKYPAGLVNFRDVGGLPAAGGLVTKSGVLYRGASPYFLGAREVAALVNEYGVRTRVDVRSREEIDETPNEALAAFPITRELALHSGGTRWGATAPPGAVAHELVAEHYTRYLAHSGAALATLARTLIHDGPVFVHCTAGKDRTGTAVAVLLDAVGVEREPIIADYAATGEQLEPLLAHLHALPAYTTRLNRLPAEALSSWPETMATFLDRLHREYDGGRGFLTSAAAGDSPLTLDELQHLRHTLLSAPGD